MKRITTAWALLVGLAASGCAIDPVASSAPTPAASATSSTLTTDDVDYAQECTGILTYAENASLDELHSYLPINVVNALIARRAQGPFHSIAEISEVPGIAQARLALIGQHASQLDYTDVGCLGVFEELAVSYDDAAAIVGYANTASAAALATVVRFDPDETVAQLIARRPFTTLQEVVDTYGIGPATLRSLRDAAIDGPLDLLIARVNNAHRDVTITLSFDWFSVLFQEPGRPAHIECFGVDEDLVHEVFGSIRPALADGQEVITQVTSSVGYANRFGGLGTRPPASPTSAARSPASSSSAAISATTPIRGAASIARSSSTPRPVTACSPRRAGQSKMQSMFRR